MNPEALIDKWGTIMRGQLGKSLVWYLKNWLRRHVGHGFCLGLLDPGSAQTMAHVKELPSLMLEHMPGLPGCQTTHVNAKGRGLVLMTQGWALISGVSSMHPL